MRSISSGECTPLGSELNPVQSYEMRRDYDLAVTVLQLPAGSLLPFLCFETLVKHRSYDDGAIRSSEMADCHSVSDHSVEQ